MRFINSRVVAVTLLLFGKLSELGCGLFAPYLSREKYI